MVETPVVVTPRRRWFQFRLRTLLVGVVLMASLCAYVAHEAKFVAERKAIRERLADAVWFIPHSLPHPSKLSWLRKFMGDEEVSEIDVPPAELHEHAELKSLFPEADVSKVSYPHP